MLLITGFDPWAVGNGSSMRAGHWCRALEGAGGFEAVVVPTAGTTPTGFRRVPLPTDDEVVRGAAQLMGARWREWMLRADPLPEAATRVPAWMGRALLPELPWRPDGVVVFKMTLAPLAADLALECGVPLVVDLDDDEATLARSVGRADADAVERLLQGTAGLAAVVTLAADTDAAAVATRVGTTVRVVPNVVAVPAPMPPGRPGSALYVANFDYAPNRASARWLLDEVVPHVEGLHELSVVGPFSQRLECAPPVVAHGKVPDLQPYYNDAAVVVCPVLAGSGTSIKVIEAMACGRPVVTTTVGARGLGLVDGEHAVITDDPLAFAAAVSRLLMAPDEAAALGGRGRALVAERYSAVSGAAAMTSALLAALGSPGDAVR